MDERVLDIVRRAAANIAASFVKNYKCSPDEATEFFYNAILRNESLVKIITSSAKDKQLSKNAIYKDHVKRFKKELYFNLRRYKGGDTSRESLLEALQHIAAGDSNKRAELLRQLSTFHVSTGERFPQLDYFYDLLMRQLDGANVIADIGCGVQPLYFPVDKHRVQRYIALDRDRDSVTLMKAFRDAFPGHYMWLDPTLWNISNGWEEVLAGAELKEFDVALMLKLVPVVRRVEPALLDILAAVPAQKIILSGVKESMVKKHDIEHKERRSINNFISQAGRSVIAEFDIDNEFFVVAS